MIGRKQVSDQDNWTRTLNRLQIAFLDSQYRYAGLDRLIDKTITDIRKVTAGKNVAFGWSGGKDSLALEWICRRAGLNQCILVICNLEFPAFLQWATDHMPSELTIWNTGLDLDWLRTQPTMLFPKTAHDAARWFRCVQHTGQAAYYRERGLDMLLLGRRYQDGNFISRDGSKVYKNRQGIVRYSPLADWSHEHVLALIAREKIELPPCYQWPRGFQVGTGPWPARQYCVDDAQGWREVYQIDPGIVRQAATNGFRGAIEHLERLL